MFSNIMCCNERLELKEVMDKYEFNIKMEQVRKLAAKKEYEEASRLAKELNWLKCKDWQALATAINVHETAGDYDEAREQVNTLEILAKGVDIPSMIKLMKQMVPEFKSNNSPYEKYDKAEQITSES